MLVGYVATMCRVGRHDFCAERPVVTCDCACHDAADAGGAGAGAPDDQPWAYGTAHAADLYHPLDVADRAAGPAH